MPTGVKASLWLYCGAAVLAVLLRPPLLAIFAIPGLVLVAFIAYHIARRRHWARVLLLILTMLVAWRSLHLLSNPWPQWRLVPLAPKLLQGVAVALLFTTRARWWFNDEHAQVTGSGAPKRGYELQIERRPVSSVWLSVARRWILVPVALGALLFLADRAWHIGLDHIFGSGENPTKGDWLYPRVNPKPTHFVHVSGMMASTLPASIDAMYETRAPAAYPVHDMSCFRNIFGYGPVPLMVTIPLKLDRDQDRFHTMLIVDHFARGGCGWHFMGLGIRPLKGELGGDATFIFARAYRPSDVPVDSGTGPYTGPLDLWCRYSPPGKFDAVIICWALPDIRSNYPALKTEAIVNDKSEVYVLRGTKSLTVNFHDISGDRYVPWAGPKPTS